MRNAATSTRLGTIIRNVRILFLAIIRPLISSLDFARSDYEGKPVTELTEIIDLFKPTALIGLSSKAGAFTQSVVEAMRAINPLPIIFALSNPSSACELSFENAIKWTKGSVLYASGSPYESFSYEGKVYHPSQANNMYVFPGIGFGAVLAQAKYITDDVFEAAGKYHFLLFTTQLS